MAGTNAWRRQEGRSDGFVNVIAQSGDSMGGAACPIEICHDRGPPAPAHGCLQSKASSTNIALCGYVCTTRRRYIQISQVDSDGDPSSTGKRQSMTTPQLILAGHALPYWVVIPPQVQGASDMEQIARFSMGTALLKSTISHALPKAAINDVSVFSRVKRLDKPGVHMLLTLKHFESKSRKGGLVAIDSVRRLVHAGSTQMLPSCPHLDDRLYQSKPSATLVFLDATYGQPPVVNREFHEPVVVQLFADARLSEHAMKYTIEFLNSVASRSHSGSILVVSTATLTDMGVELAEERSWEHFLEEFLGVRENSLLNAFSAFDHVVVRNSSRGALWQQRSSPAVRKFFYLAEPDNPRLGISGFLVGYTSLLTTCVVSAILDRGAASINDVLESALKKGVACSAQLRKWGYGNDGDPGVNPDWGGRLFDYPVATESVRCVTVPGAVNSRTMHWSLLSEVIAEAAKNKSGEEEHRRRIAAVKIGVSIVVNGIDEAQLQFGFPVANYGDIVITSRQEFEEYWELSSLIEFYRLQASANPLGIGVFGPPGAGKSFGLKELLRTLSIPKEAIIEANVAQMVTKDQMANVLHRARDFALSGDVPVVLLDEFDTLFDGQRFGWLQFFLAPLQDGKFRQNENVYNVGRTIFIFIGGVNSSFDMFDARRRDRDFIEAKGPDFISRLRGHLNIPAIDEPIQPKPNGDFGYVLRRAVLLRKFLERHQRLIIKTSTRQADITNDLVWSLLTVDRFKHSTRSLEAIIQMSRVGPLMHKFHWGCLPANDQLEMHVSVKNLGNARKAYFDCRNEL